METHPPTKTGKPADQLIRKESRAEHHGILEETGKSFSRHVKESAFSRPNVFGHRRGSSDAVDLLGILSLRQTLADYEIIWTCTEPIVSTPLSPPPQSPFLTL